MAPNCLTRGADAGRRDLMTREAGVKRRSSERFGWTLIGLIVAGNVAQGSLMKAASSVGGLANLVFVIGIALSLAAHEGVQHLVGRAAAARGEHGAPDARAAEMAAAGAGPIANFLFSLAIIVAARVAYVSGGADPLVRSLAAVAAFNVLVAGVNLLPVLPLDGGRVLRAALGGDTDRARRIVGGMTEVAALLIAAAGVAEALVADLADAASWVLAGVVLLAEGRAETRAVAEVAAAGQADVTQVPGREDRQPVTHGSG